MSQHAPTVIDQLETEWEVLLRRGVVDEALRRWSTQRPQLACRSVGDLFGRLADRSLPTGEQDRLLTVLLELARNDPLVRRVLLQRFLPCLKRLTRWRGPIPRDEWVGLVVATAYEVICNYPLDRRPNRIAANIVWDVRQRALILLAERRRTLAELARWRRGWPPREDRDAERMLAAVDTRNLLEWAVRKGVIDEGTAELLVRTRVDDLSVVAVASQVAKPADTLRQRRWRAERRLATALSGVS